MKSLFIAGTEVLLPIDDERPRAFHLAPRPLTLEGAVLGFLDNTKENVAELFQEIEEGLSGRFSLKEVIRVRKDHYALRSPEGLLDELARRCTLVITGVGS